MKKERILIYFSYYLLVFFFFFLVRLKEYKFHFLIFEILTLIETNILCSYRTKKGKTKNKKVQAKYVCKTSISFFFHFIVIFVLIKYKKK